MTCSEQPGRRRVRAPPESTPSERKCLCTSLCLLEGAAGPPVQTGFLSELINISSTPWLWTKEALAPTSVPCGSILRLIRMRVICLRKCDCLSVLPNRHEHHPHSQPPPFSIRRQQKFPQSSCIPLCHFLKGKCRGQTALLQSGPSNSTGSSDFLKRLWMTLSLVSRYKLLCYLF